MHVLQLLLLRETFDASALIRGRKVCDELFASAVPVEGTMSLSTAVVLVVEDSPLILMGALDLVRTAGFKGVGAASADEAIAILEVRADIHLVFTDVEMPGTIDGVELAHYIRNRWPLIQLIVASGRTILDESQLPTGSIFFSKPYDNNAIIKKMAKMLAVIDADQSGH